MMKRLFKVFIIFVIIWSYLYSNIYAKEYTDEELNEIFNETIKTNQFEDYIYSVTVDDGKIKVNSKNGNLEYSYSSGDRFITSNFKQYTESNYSDEDVKFLITDLVVYGVIYQIIADENGADGAKAYLYFIASLIENYSKDDFIDTNKIVIKDEKFNSFVFTVEVEEVSDSVANIKTEMIIDTTADYSKVENSVVESIENMDAAIGEIISNYSKSINFESENTDTVSDIVESGSAIDPMSTTEVNNSINTNTDNKVTIKDGTQQENKMPYTGIEEKSKIKTIIELVLLGGIIATIIVSNKSKNN